MELKTNLCGKALILEIIPQARVIEAASQLPAQNDFDRKGISSFSKTSYCSRRCGHKGDFSSAEMVKRAG